MRPLLLAVTLVSCLFACGGSGGPCENESGGAYRLDYTYVSGNCGQWNETEVVFPSTPPTGCTGTKTSDPKTCQVTLSSYSCGTNASGWTWVDTGEMTWAHDASSGSGEITYIGSNSSTGQSCSGTYKLQYTRQ
jgi:hypothetical protein